MKQRIWFWALTSFAVLNGFFTLAFLWMGHYLSMLGQPCMVLKVDGNTVTVQP